MLMTIDYRHTPYSKLYTQNFHFILLKKTFIYLHFRKHIRQIDLKITQQ
jgi:hypothetical protein